MSDGIYNEIRDQFPYVEQHLMNLRGKGEDRSPYRPALTRPSIPIPYDLYSAFPPEGLTQGQRSLVASHRE